MVSVKRIYLCLLLILLIVTVGTVGYVVGEGYTPLEALYMTVITITTVGFGEVRPLSEAGQLFTTFLIVAGFGSMGFAVHTVFEAFLDNMLSGAMEERNMRKKIEQLRAHYIICGYGRVGSVSAEHFYKADADFVIIESNTKLCEEIRKKGFLYVSGDAINEETLLAAGIKSAGGLLAVLPSDPDNLFVALTARELNPTLQIIARAEESASEKKLLRAGADSVISPFITAGREIAGNMLATTGKPVGVDAVSSMVRVESRWISVQEGSGMTGRNIAEISENMGYEVVGLRRRGRDVLSPDVEEQLQSGDALFVIEAGHGREGECAVREAEPRKVVLVDDNPVVLRFYSRLLRRSGFIPLTATNGREALDLICSERPDVAVIDIMLPVLSGIEVCKELRAKESCRDIKLVLFTGDDQPETCERALEAGADAFVIKSSESSELIETVIKVLKETDKELNERVKPKKPEEEKFCDSVKLEAEAEKNGVMDMDEVMSRFDGDIEFFREVAEIFLQDTPRLMAEIRGAIDEGDAQRLEYAAHSLKGSVSNFCVRQAIEAALLTEHAGRDGILESAEELYSSLETEIERLVPELTQIVIENAAA